MTSYDRPMAIEDPAVTNSPEAGARSHQPTARTRSRGLGELTDDEDLEFDDEVVEPPGSPLSRLVDRTDNSGRSAGVSSQAARRGRLEARQVRRLIRHVDPWSMLKASLLFFLSLWFVFMIAAVIVWTVARGSGTVGKIETFVVSNLGFPDFKFDGDFLFRQVGLVGLVGVLGWTIAAVIASVLFNLISDIIGGVWVTVIEEETARPRRESTVVD